MTISTDNDLAVNGSVPLTINVTPAANLSGDAVLSNDATVTGQNPDPNPGNNTDNELTPVARSADLTIDKSDRGETAFSGQNFTYQVKVSNLGTSDSSGWSVTDTLPTGMTFVSATNGDITTTTSGNTVTFASNTDISSGGSRTFDVTVRIASNVADGTILNNQVVVTGQDPDPNPGNNTDIEPTPVIASPGVRTPGFWQGGGGKWLTFWDGIQGNEPAQAGTTNFPKSDLMFSPYTNSAVAGKVKDPVTGQYDVGLLIGDYNRNGMTDAGENTIFYTRAQAVQIVDSSQHPNKQDVRYTLARDLVATWLNFLSGNPIDTVVVGDKDTKYYIQEGIDWLQALTPDENTPKDGKGDGALNQLTNSTVSSPVITAGSSYWNSGISSASGLPSPYNLNTSVIYPVDAGNAIHTALDNYNNTGFGADGAFHP